MKWRIKPERLCQAVRKWLEIAAKSLRDKLKVAKPKIMTGMRMFNNMEWSTIKPSVHKIVGDEGSNSKFWLKTSNEQVRAQWKALPPDQKQKYNQMAQALNSGEASKKEKAKSVSFVSPVVPAGLKCFLRHGDRYFVDHVKKVVDHLHEQYNACVMIVTVRLGEDDTPYVYMYGT